MSREPTFKRQERINEDEMQRSFYHPAKLETSSFKSDYSVCLEDEIEMLQQEIDFFYPETQNYRVGTTKMTLDDKDTIFLAQKAIAPAKYVRTPACLQCPKDKPAKTFNNDSSRVFCKFCGINACKDCCQKKRNFPKAQLGADGKIPRGEICMLCDRKFLVRNNFIGDKASYQKKQAQELALNNELIQLQTDIQELNLLRNLKKWSHNQRYRSEVAAQKAIIKNTEWLTNELTKYRKILNDRGANAEGEKVQKKNKLQQEIEASTKAILEKQLAEQQIVKAEKNAKEKSDLELRIERLEQWQVQFTVDSCKQTLNVRADFSKKNLELRQLLKIQEESNQQLTNLFAQAFYNQTEQLVQIGKVVSSLTESSTIEGLDLTALKENTLQFASESSKVTEQLQKIQTVTMSELQNEGLNLESSKLEMKAEFVPIQANSTAQKLFEEISALRDSFEHQQDELDQMRVLFQVAYKSNLLQQQPISTEHEQQMRTNAVKTDSLEQKVQNEVQVDQVAP